MKCIKKGDKTLFFNLEKKIVVVVKETTVDKIER